MEPPLALSSPPNRLAQFTSKHEPERAKFDFNFLWIEFGLFCYRKLARTKNTKRKVMVFNIFCDQDLEITIKSCTQKSKAKENGPRDEKSSRKRETKIPFGFSSFQNFGLCAHFGLSWIEWIRKCRTCSDSFTVHWPESWHVSANKNVFSFFLFDYFAIEMLSRRFGASVVNCNDRIIILSIGEGAVGCLD